MPELFPASLPGILVESNNYQNQRLGRNNDLARGFPVYGLKNDNGWVAFDVAWAFTYEDMIVFRDWFRNTLVDGSKSFLIDIATEGRAGGSYNLEQHTCYFDGSYTANQDESIFRVSCRLIAIEQITASEEIYDQLEILDDAFEDLWAAFPALECFVEKVEERWLP